MMWPVLGSNRARAQRKRSVDPTEPAGSKKPRLSKNDKHHWNMKLATLYKYAEMPDAIEKLIESLFFVQPHLANFHKHYGNVITLNAGHEGFLSGWHPRLPSATMRRWIWPVFPKEATPDKNACCMNIAQLEGKRAIVTYKARNRTHSIEHAIRVVHAGPYSMIADSGNGSQGYTLSYSGVLAMSLYVDFPR